MVSEVEKALAEYADLLTIELVGDYYVIKPKTYIHDKAKWDEINRKVLSLRGEYKGGLGKESHWKAPRNGRSKPVESFGSVQCPHCRGKIEFTVGAPK